MHSISKGIFKFKIIQRNINENETLNTLIACKRLEPAEKTCVEGDTLPTFFE